MTGGLEVFVSMKIVPIMAAANCAGVDKNRMVILDDQSISPVDIRNTI
jgi:hypothetical protein